MLSAWLHCARGRRVSPRRWGRSVWAAWAAHSLGAWAPRHSSPPRLVCPLPPCSLASLPAVAVPWGTLVHCAPVGEAAPGMRWGTVPPMPALAPWLMARRGMRSMARRGLRLMARRQGWALMGLRLMARRGLRAARV